MLYVKKYNLKHIMTGDILIEALDKNLITEDEGNIIWANMISRRRLLPTSTFTEFLQQYKHIAGIN